MRVAMWSGPRNLSTAMMYAFAQRAHCRVWDEPFYAAYLDITGLDHPMRSEILSDGEADPDRVIARCLDDRPAVFYQKHMTHHMLPEIDRSWLSKVTNVFLIRHPARVIASYDVKRESPTMDDIGFRQQFELFEHVLGLGQNPVVIDSEDIRANPKQFLTKLCEAIGLEFDPAMLSWEAGAKLYDGAWAPHWYGSVHRSVGFAGKEGPLPELNGPLAELAKEAEEVYESLRKFAIK